MKNKSYSIPATAHEACLKMNQFGAGSIPFLFVIDYEMKQPLVLPLEELEAEDIFYRIAGKSNFKTQRESTTKNVDFEKFPTNFKIYQGAFNHVKNQLQRGNSFLVNLTQPTPVTTNLSLREIFQRSRSKYNLYFQDKFVVFSPETFIKIRNGLIYSHPMKGTIDQRVINAEDLILNNPKELAEHATMVDLIRNDLSVFSKNVTVNRFRYIDRIETHKSGLLQVSSEICGELPVDYQDQIGNLLFSMLPAGSVTGAPKIQTQHIIREAEGYERGFYTGVFGIFDGENMDSAVMIRFIEKTKSGLIFKSGGGITASSEATSEYQEMIDKVYLPF